MRLDSFFTFYDLQGFSLNDTKDNFESMKNYIIKKNIAFINRDDFYSNNTIKPDCEFILKKSFLKDKSFVVKPSNFEIKNNILILGSRFDWITVNEPFFFHPFFYFGDKSLDVKFITLPYLQGKYYHYLENETEYLNNVLNQHRDNSNHFDIMTPESNIKIKALDMKMVYSKLNIIEGERLRIRFPNATFQNFEIAYQKEKPLLEKEITKLQKIFDEQLKKICLRLKTFSNKVNSISNLFFLENKTLFGKKQLSIEEMFLKSKTVSVIDYGYDGLIWVNKFPDPITNSWNMIINSDDTNYDDFFTAKLKRPINNNIIQTLMEKFLYDSFLNPNITDDSLNRTLEKIFINEKHLTDEDKKHFFEILEKEKSKVKEYFNPFSERPDIVNVRNIILTLYLDIVGFVSHLIDENFIPSSFENQQGIKLNQLLERVISITHLYATAEFPFEIFLESINSFENMNESFKMIKSSIKVQIQNMKI